MICKNCGNQVPDGMKFCSKCGTAMEQQTPTFNAGGQRPTNNYGGGYTKVAAPAGNKQLWLAVMAVLAMLGIMSIVCGSMSINSGNGSISIPYMSVTALVGNAMKAVRSTSSILPISSGVINGGVVALISMIFYTVFASICIILYVLSVVFTLKRKSIGIVSGMVASALAILLSIIMIIVSFVAGSQADGAIGPSVWLWLAIPIGILYALFCAIKSRELIS